MAGTLTIDTIQTGTGVNISTASIAKGLAKAWVSFTGAGVIRSSFNVTSVTRTAAGAYTINFTTPMADVNYAVVSMSSDTPSVGQSVLHIASVATGNFTVHNNYIPSGSGLTFYDADINCLVVFGN